MAPQGSNRSDFMRSSIWTTSEGYSSAVGSFAGDVRLRAMRKFYFHLFDDEDVWDQEGVDLPNEAEALRMGETTAREMAAQSVREGCLVLGHRIVVCAENNRSVGTIHFRDVVEIQD